MLKIEKLVKKYKDKIILNELNFHLKVGKIKALIGLNGAGKTTLTEIVCGVQDFDSGNIFINNLDIEFAGVEIKYLLGYVPQSFSFYGDLTVKENLEYVVNIFGEEKCRSILEIVEMCKLKGKENVLAQNLSGGYKQFLSIACVLIHNPKLLILDEPTSAMDPIFRRLFWDILKKEKENGITILIITHHLEEVLRCDEVALLSGGKIVIEEDIDNLKENSGGDFEKLISNLTLKGNANET